MTQTIAYEQIVTDERGVPLIEGTTKEELDGDIERLKARGLIR